MVRMKVLTANLYVEGNYANADIVIVSKVLTDNAWAEDEATGTGEEGMEIVTDGHIN